MKKVIIAILLSAVLFLTGCGEPVAWRDQPEAYVKNLAYKDGFVVVQMSDLHWDVATDVPASRAFVTGIVNEVLNEKGHIDLIVWTGDQFLSATRAHVRAFVDMMDSFEIPYTIVFGNHDMQGFYSPEWLSDYLESGKYSLFTDIYDNLPGRSNYIVNLTKDGTADSEVCWQLAMLDSGVTKNDTAFTLSMSYCNLTEEQVDWWQVQHDAVGKDVPCIAYYHVVEGDIVQAWNEIENGAELKHKFFQHEKFSTSPDLLERLFEAGKDQGLKAVFFGHDHSSDLTVDYQGVTIGYGVKSSQELYTTFISKEEAETVGLSEGFELTGASVVTLHDGGCFDLEHLYYNEKEDGVWKGWVKY